MEAASHPPPTTGPATVARPTRRRFARTVSLARWDEYERILDHALEAGYRLVSLEDWLADPDPPDDPTLLLRHDVDQHPRAVRPMLETERRLGVTSTWYFRWRTADPSVIGAFARRGRRWDFTTRRSRDCSSGPANA